MVNGPNHRFIRIVVVDQSIDSYLFAFLLRFFSHLLMNVGNLRVRGRPTSSSKRWVIGNEYVGVTDPRTRRIKSLVTSQTNRAKLRITVPERRCIVFLSLSWIVCPKARNRCLSQDECVTTAISFSGRVANHSIIAIPRAVQPSSGSRNSCQWLSSSVSKL